MASGAAYSWFTCSSTDGELLSNVVEIPCQPSWWSSLPLSVAKGLPADPEVTARQGGVVPAGPVIVKPLQSVPGHPGESRQPGQACSPRNPCCNDSHDDTLPVSPIIMNEFTTPYQGEINELYASWALERTTGRLV